MSAVAHTVTTETDNAPLRPIQHRRQGGTLHARRVKR